MKARIIKPSSMIILMTICFLSLPIWAVGLSDQGQEKSADRSNVQLPPAVRPNTDTMALIRRRGKLRVGIALFTPWIMKNKSGELIGYEIDLAKKMADDLGVKVEFVEAENLINELLEDRIDVIGSGIYITPQRALLMNFTDPNASSEVNLLANNKFAGEDVSLESFNKPEVKIGAVQHTVNVDLAKENLPQASFQEFASQAEMIEGLMAEKVDAVIASSPIPEITVQFHGEKVFMPLTEPIDRFDESFAIRKGDGDFLSYLNTWIRFYKDNGWLEQRRTYWFNGLEWTKELQ